MCGNNQQHVVKALIKGDFSPQVLADAIKLRGNLQEDLFSFAREVRDTVFPDKEVEARSVLEISNICCQQCQYCNMGGKNKDEYYTLSINNVMDIASHIYTKGTRVLMLQSGENSSKQFIDYVCKCVSGIKSQHPDLVILLCLGNLSKNDLTSLYNAGAERYLLKFESSNPEYYEYIKPSDKFSKRIQTLVDAISVGFKVGTGNITGLPGQTDAQLIYDIMFTKGFFIQMVSSSVFIAGEKSNFAGYPSGDVDTTLNVMALLRILHPNKLIPTTSSLEKIQPGGQLRGLMAGANTVTIHDGTPEELRDAFPIYSTYRFTPKREYLSSIVDKAGMRIGRRPLL